METLIYLGKVNLFWVIFYICYRLFLHKHTFFAWNRAFLLCSLLLAIALPAIRLPQEAPMVAQSAIYIAEAIPSYTAIAPSAEPSPFPWEQFVFALIGMGAACMLARLLHAFQSLYNVIRQGDVVTFEDHTLVLLPHNQTGSFSFFKWLVVNRSDYENNLDLILRHEITHIKQMHSWDIMFIETLKIFCWFNPVLWLFKSSMQEIHEFLADETAPNRERYATFLVSYGLKAPIQSLTNHFMNSSSLKNRIAMIYKTRTSKWLLGKYAMIIPVMLIIILSTASNTHLNRVSKTIEENTTAPSPSNVVTAKPLAPASEVKQDTPGERESFDIKGVILDELGKPVSRATLLLADEKLLGKTDENGQFRITGVDADSRISVSHVSFVPQQFVTKKALTDYKVILTRNKIMLDEVVVVGYGLANRTGVSITVDSAALEGNSSVQKMPEFPGGPAEMYKYIAKKIKYPTEASRANIQGRVFVAFTVNENGHIRNPKVVKGLGGGTDEEALRVVLTMPSWKPAEQNGEKVSADYAIAIKFALEN